MSSDLGYEYRDAGIRMSQKAMANFMYACIKTRSKITCFFILDHSYSRAQDSYNNVWIKVHIHPRFIPQFEALAGCKLDMPESITIS